MRSELKVLARLLAAYSDEKLKEIKRSIDEMQDGVISLEEVERSLREKGLISIADSLKGNLERGTVQFSTHTSCDYGHVELHIELRNF